MFDQLKILKYFFQARHLMSFSNREDLIQHQHNMMNKFRYELLNKLPHYKTNAFNPLSSFPLSDKEYVRSNFESLNRLGISHTEARTLLHNEDFPELNDITIGMSSGTSGNRGIFLVSKDERLKWLGIILAKALGHKIWRKQRIALMLSANSKLYTTVNHSRHLKFIFFDLKQDFENHLSELEKFNPTILLAPAQALNLIAEEKMNNQLDILPEKIFSIGEVLEQDQNDNISKSFQQIVHQIYQCTEGFLGITCDQGTLHLNEEYVHFEKQWIDKNRSTFNPIITDFTRRTQAMVRYQMNDILVERKTPCSCGSAMTAIERIEGRCDDILVFESNNKQKYMFPDDIRALILDVLPKVSDFSLVQKDTQKIEISLKGQTQKGDEEKLKYNFSKAIAALNIKVPEISFTAYQTPAIDQKLRRIKREFQMGKSIS